MCILPFLRLGGEGCWKFGILSFGGRSKYLKFQGRRALSHTRGLYFLGRGQLNFRLFSHFEMQDYKNARFSHFEMQNYKTKESFEKESA